MHLIEEFNGKSDTVARALWNVYLVLSNNLLLDEVAQVADTVEEKLASAGIFISSLKLSDITIDNWTDYKRLQVELKPVTVAEQDYDRFLDIATTISVDCISTRVTREVQFPSEVSASVTCDILCKLPPEIKNVLRSIGAISLIEPSPYLSVYSEVISCGR